MRMTQVLKADYQQNRSQGSSRRACMIRCTCNVCTIHKKWGAGRQAEGADRKIVRNPGFQDTNCRKSQFLINNLFDCTSREKKCSLAA